MSVLDKAWLPEGHHFGLHVEHDKRDDGGSYIDSGWKICWHTVEGTDLRNAQRELKQEGYEPHVVIGRQGTGRQDFTAVQFIPFTQSSRALEHPRGTPETNRAHAIQVEICEFAKNAQEWDKDLIDALGALTVLIEHRFDVPRKAPKKFAGAGVAQRFSASGWINATGHVGHEHAPNQPSHHWDPGVFPTRRVFAAAKAAAHAHA